MLIDHLKPFLDWLHIHPELAGFFVFLISFGESIAVFGLLVPGSVVMTAIGALMGAGILPIYPILAWAIAGAVLGDIFSFWLGAHFHQGVRNLWPFSRYPRVLIKGEEFFEKHGGKSVFLGRFVGPIRPVIPLIAGMLGMKPTRFFIADIPAAIAWAPTYMLPGILVGQLSLKLQPEVATRFVLAIFALLIVLWLIYWLLKESVLAVTSSIRYILTNFWLRFSRRVKWMAFMQVPGNYPDARQFRVFVFSLLLLIVFTWMTYSVFHHGIFTDLNYPIFYLMRSLQNATANYVMNGITFLAATPVMVASSIVVALYLIAKRRFWAVSHWIAVNLLCWGGVNFIKNWVQSPRPGNLLSSQYGWSFPSGHTALAMTILGFLAMLMTQNTSLLVKRCCYSVVALIVVAVGVSRIYLGFHWFSDVIGGIVFGLLIVVGTTFSYRRRNSVANAFTPLCTAALLSWFLAWGVYTFHYFSHVHKVITPYAPVQVLDENVWWNQLGYKPPLYRTNRFGKPVQLINIQWAGDLPTIQNALLKSGWKIAIKPDLALIMSSFANKETSHLNPILFTKYYGDRKPVLVMTKVVDNQHHVIIIRLWNSHTIFYKSGYAIFVGTVGYYRPWQLLFLKHHLANEATRISAIDEFKKDLGPLRWKELFYQSQGNFKVGENADWTGYALLIKPSAG